MYLANISQRYSSLLTRTRAYSLHCGSLPVALYPSRTPHTGTPCRFPDGFRVKKYQIKARTGEGGVKMGSDPLLVDEMPSEATGFLESPPSPTSPPFLRQHRPRILVILGTVAGVVFLAVALGFGLGFVSLGRTHGSPSGVENWRLDTSQYVLDMDWDLEAPPTTRYFNLVITEGKGWPDGMPLDPGENRRQPRSQLVRRGSRDALHQRPVPRAPD